VNNLKVYPFQPIEALLGFASKSGKITAGDNATKDKLKKGNIYLIVLASDASHELIDYYTFQSVKKKISLICAGSKLDLGLAIGKSQRAVVGITDKQLAGGIINLIKEQAGMD